MGNVIIEQIHDDIQEEDIVINNDGSLSIFVEVAPVGWIEVKLSNEQMRYSVVFDWLRDHR